MTLLLVIVLLTSELPDPGRIATITFVGTFGACVGVFVAHVRRLPSERAGDLMRIGMLVGFGTGLLGWLAAFAIDRL